MLVWMIIAVLVLAAALALIGYVIDSEKVFYSGLIVASCGVVLTIILGPAIDRAKFQSMENTYYMRGSTCTVYADGSATTYTVDRITDTVILKGVKTGMTTEEFFEKLEITFVCCITI